MFNNYVWEIYLKAGGKEVVEMFERNLTEQISDEYIERIMEYRELYCPSKTIVEKMKQQLNDLKEDIQDWFLLESGEYTIQSALESLYKGLMGEENCSEQMVFDCFSTSIDYYTTFLSIEISDLFIPYYFQYNFNVFESIAKEFEIDLPEIPLKKDYLGRFFYYAKVCDALLDFREKYNMTSFELCAFLYDFAPKYIGGSESYIVEDLPEPKSAYFIGASKDDLFLTDGEDIITCWQCNPDTRAGDMIVMYMRTPVSAIDSVWRSVSIGFNDPFFYHYRCTYIARPKKINRITQKQLQADEIFKELPIVRKNMQGINGVELYPSVYNHLLDIAKSDLQRFDFAIENGMDLKIEKDVEETLVKPLLGRLGYTEKDYVQQLQIRVGNHNFKLIPDFVIKPKVSNGHYSAFYHIEVKLSIPSNKILEDVKIQARSYAKQLGAPYSVVVAKEGIWIASKDDDYSKDILSLSWDEVNDADKFYEMFKIIGNGNGGGK